MPLKTNVGVSRKVSDNNYGSCGASVNLEVELDSALINEPDRFHERIRQVFRLAKQAIDEELGRQQSNGTANRQANGATNGQTTQASYNGNGHTTNGNGNGAGNNHANGNGQHSNGYAGNGNGQGSNGGARTVSEKQLNFAKQLSKAIRGLGVRNLENLVQKMYGKPLAAITSMEASNLIDTLQAIKSGEISLESVLEGNAV